MINTEPTDSGRRDFLGKAAVAAATLVAPGVVLHAAAEAGPRSEPVSSKVRWGMLIDTTKCADGCRACVDACDRENGKFCPGYTEKTFVDCPGWIRMFFSSFRL